MKITDILDKHHKLHVIEISITGGATVKNKSKNKNRKIAIKTLENVKQNQIQNCYITNSLHNNICKYWEFVM